MREHAAIVRHAHAAEDDVVAIAECVDVVTLADADVHVALFRRMCADARVWMPA